MILNFIAGSVSFNPRESLKSWHDKNHHFLELSAVYRCVTNDLRVTVLPFYMGSRVIVYLSVSNQNLTTR